AKVEHPPVEYGVSATHLVMDPQRVVAEELPDMFAVPGRYQPERYIRAALMEWVDGGGGRGRLRAGLGAQRHGGEGHEKRASKECTMHGFKLTLGRNDPLPALQRLARFPVSQ